MAARKMYDFATTAAATAQHKSTLIRMNNKHVDVGARCVCVYASNLNHSQSTKRLITQRSALKYANENRFACFCLIYLVLNWWIYNK